MAGIKATELDRNTGIEPVKFIGYYQALTDIDNIADILIDYFPSVTAKYIGLAVKVNSIKNTFDLGESDKAYSKINILGIIERYTNIEKELLKLRDTLDKRVYSMNQLYANSINLGGTPITEIKDIKEFTDLVYKFNEDFNEAKRGEMFAPTAPFLLEKYFEIQKSLNDKKRSEIAYAVAKVRSDLYSKCGSLANVLQISYKEEILRKNNDNIFVKLTPEGKETLKRAMKKVVWDKTKGGDII